MCPVFPATIKKTFLIEWRSSTFPLTSTRPRCSVKNLPRVSSNSFVSMLIWIFIGCPVVSILRFVGMFTWFGLCTLYKYVLLSKGHGYGYKHCGSETFPPRRDHFPRLLISNHLLAVLTVSPKRQYRGILLPTTPDTTGPVWIPILRFPETRFGNAIKDQMYGIACRSYRQRVHTWRLFTSRATSPRACSNLTMKSWF